jgi:hypothetical protein
MKKQEEIEKDILDYYKKYVENDMIKDISKYNFENQINDFIKFHFTYIDYSAPLTFSPDPIDFVIYSKKEKRFIYIEYPWRQKNGELTYNKIYL